MEERVGLSHTIVNFAFADGCMWSESGAHHQGGLPAPPRRRARQRQRRAGQHVNVFLATCRAFAAPPDATERFTQLAEQKNKARATLRTCSACGSTTTPKTGPSRTVVEGHVRVEALLIRPTTRGHHTVAAARSNCIN